VPSRNPAKGDVEWSSWIKSEESCATVVRQPEVRRVLPHRAEDEIRRLRNVTLREELERMKKMMKKRNDGDDDGCLAGSGAQTAGRKKRKSKGEVWFTTLAEVSSGGEEYAVTADDELDVLFSQSLREICEDDLWRLRCCSK
jgi:hypothetical protein